MNKRDQATQTVHRQYSIFIFLEATYKKQEPLLGSLDHTGAGGTQK